MRTLQYLEYNSFRFPARITRVGNPSQFGPVRGIETTHTATIPLTSAVVVNVEVTDQAGTTYRVVGVKEVLGKLRLELVMRGH